MLRRDPTAAEAVLDDLMTRTHEAGEDVRRLVYELRPPALDDLGLVGAIREAAIGVLPAIEPQVVVETLQPLPPMPAAVELAAYRIAQAGLANVASHADARTCSVRLWLDDAALNVEVLDDGRGLPKSVRAGVGLVSMRERAAELGGSCSIDSAAGGGTRVLARLPLADGAENVS
jgi:signal transduction histidine kinase